MSASTTFNITDSFTGFIEPNYPEPVVSKWFNSEEECNCWLESEAKKHCSFRITKNAVVMPKPGSKEFPNDVIHQLVKVCTYEGHCQVKPEVAIEERPLKKSRKTKGTSKRIGCPVRLTKKTLRNGMIQVIYKWQHEGHNPANIDEALREKLSPEVKKWIEENVDRNMNWASIKHILRLDEENMQKVLTIIILQSKKVPDYLLYIDRGRGCDSHLFTY